LAETFSVERVKAEEGLTGLIQPNAEEQISTDGGYPSELTLHLVDDLADEEKLDFKDLDSEGRAVVIDVELFLLINVYCPNTSTGTDEHAKYKKY
jgi:AP endonuclease 2